MLTRDKNVFYVSIVLVSIFENVAISKNAVVTSLKQKLAGKINEQAK